MDTVIVPDLEDAADGYTSDESAELKPSHFDPTLM